MVGLCFNGLQLSLGEQSPTSAVPIFDIGKYPFLQPFEKGISTHSNNPANLCRPVIGLVFNNDRHIFFP